MPAKATVLHGVDQSGSSAKRPVKGHDGHLFYETDTQALRVWDDTQLEWLPVDYIAFVYDAAVDPKAIGTHPLAGAIVPAGTIILDGVVDVITAVNFTGAGTLAIEVAAANDIVAATTSWAAGRKAIVPDGTAANSIKATVDRQVRVVIATGAVTAGKIMGFLRTVRSLITVTEEESSSSSSTSSSNSSSVSSSSSSKSSQTTSSSSKSSQTTSSSSKSSQTTSSSSSNSSSSSVSSSSSS